MKQSGLTPGSELKLGWIQRPDPQKWFFGDIVNKRQLDFSLGDKQAAMTFT